MHVLRVLLDAGACAARAGAEGRDAMNTALQCSQAPAAALLMSYAKEKEWEERGLPGEVPSDVTWDVLGDVTSDAYICIYIYIYVHK